MRTKAIAVGKGAAVGATDTRLLPLTKIMRHGLHARVAFDRPTVDEYAEAMRCGATFPPIVVFFDGHTYWLGDGFHRLEAASEAELPALAAEVHTGSQRDAVLYEVGANTVHGLRRSNEDKRVAVRTLLEDTEWKKRSDRWIAEQCKVGHQFVARVRVELDDHPVGQRREGKDGKARQPPKRAAKDKTANGTAQRTEDAEGAPEGNVAHAEPERAEGTASREPEAAPDDGRTVHETVMQIHQLLSEAAKRYTPVQLGDIFPMLSKWARVLEKKFNDYAAQVSN